MLSGCNCLICGQDGPAAGLCYRCAVDRAPVLIANAVANARPSPSFDFLRAAAERVAGVYWQAAAGITEGRSGGG